MMHAADKNLNLIESELKFIARHVQTVEGSYDVVDEVGMAVESALRALFEYRLSIQPDAVDVEDAQGPLLVTTYELVSA